LKESSLFVLTHPVSQAKAKSILGLIAINNTVMRGA